ncbi:ABC transporter permease subunit [Murimonas intestini]|uniref:ABC transporter permease subunit n=1 Tax=Murimonas intestini TaxID=1337051 RepID=UPI0011DC8778|nr:ABC transporter permease subunit [Murimonas intestini]
MISGTLFKREIRANYILLIIFMGVLTMYSAMIVAMYGPGMGDGLKSMAESMPEIFAAAGMLNVGTTLLEFVVGYLYGILLVAFPGVFIIILANRLVARYVDQGSMAYLLATPNKRTKIAVTQALAMAAGIFVLIAYVAVLIIVVSQIMFPGELDMGKFFLVNVALFGMHLFFGGVCFLASCLFNESRLSYGTGAGIVIASILIQMISQVGDKFENLKYITPLTLFDPRGIIAGDTGALVQCVILYAAGLVMIAAGIVIFKRKDMSI